MTAGAKAGIREKIGIILPDDVNQRNTEAHVEHLKKTGCPEVLSIHGQAEPVVQHAESDIAVETRSTITYENLREARALLDSGVPPRVLIVSDPLHMRRAVTMARDLGLDAHPAPTPTSRYRSWRTRARFLAREVFFHSLYLIQRPFA